MFYKSTAVSLAILLLCGCTLFNMQWDPVKDILPTDKVVNFDLVGSSQVVNKSSTNSEWTVWENSLKLMVIVILFVFILTEVIAVAISRFPVVGAFLGKVSKVLLTIPAGVLGIVSGKWILGMHSWTYAFVIGGIAIWLSNRLYAWFVKGEIKFWFIKK